MMRATCMVGWWVLAAGGVASADGGVPIGSVAIPGGTGTLLMRPSEPRVGAMEFTLLGEVPPAWVLSVKAPGQGGPAVVPWSRERLGVREASVTIDETGPWVVSVGVPGRPPSIDATLEVAGPAAPASEHWPWLAAWLPLALLVACRNAAVTYTARRNRA